jgi:hypothetical protein
MNVNRPSDDIVIGAIGNYSWDQIKYWVNSLNRCGFQGRKILSYNSKPELIKQLTDNGIEVFPVQSDAFGMRDNFEFHTGHVDKNTTDILIHHLRFFHAWQLLSEMPIACADRMGGSGQRIIHTDVRDLIFQSNPTSWLDEKERCLKSSLIEVPAPLLPRGQYIVAPSEYIHYHNEPWNKDLSITNFGVHIHNQIVDKSLVYNVGSFAATVNTFKDLCLMTYLLTYRRDKLADQPAQAILFKTAFKDKVVTVSTADGWALQCGTLLENKERFKDVFEKSAQQPTLKDGIVYNEKNEPFVLVHQYERIPELKKALEEKYQ